MCGTFKIEREKKELATTSTETSPNWTNSKRCEAFLSYQNREKKVEKKKVDCNLNSASSIRSSTYFPLSFGVAVAEPCGLVRVCTEHDNFTLRRQDFIRILSPKDMFFLRGMYRIPFFSYCNFRQQIRSDGMQHQTHCQLENAVENECRVGEKTNCRGKEGSGREEGRAGEGRKDEQKYGVSKWQNAEK